MWAANLQQVFRQNPEGVPYSCWVLFLRHGSDTEKETHIRDKHEQIDNILADQNVNYTEITTHRGKQAVYQKFNFQKGKHPLFLILNKHPLDYVQKDPLMVIEWGNWTDIEALKDDLMAVVNFFSKEGDKMREKLLQLIEQLKSDKRLVSFDEASTKQAVILRILSLIGWDTFNIDEVVPEYSIGAKKVDFSLRHSNANKTFIEVKRIGEDLQKHQEQLLNYSFQEGVKLSILTNGITWWFYLPLHEGSWEQRKFYTIEIYDQSAEEIVGRFIDYLAKENVTSGRAITNAEAIYKSMQKKSLIKETLPKAWNRLISEPDELLIELIAESTEKLCGYKPDHSTVEDFISANLSEIEFPHRPRVEDSRRRKVSRGKIEGYIGKSVTAFTFKNTRYQVRFWKDILIKTCNLMNSIHRNNFERVLSLQGRKRPYFTKNANELRIPGKIEGTDIFVEINLSANSIVKMSLDVLSLFGYSEEDFSIEAY